MPPLGPLTLPHSRIYTNTFEQQNLCNRYHSIHTAAFTLTSTCIRMPPHSRGPILPPYSHSTYAAAFMPHHLCCRVHTAAVFLGFHAAALVLPLS